MASRQNRTPTFAFIVHPRDLNDVYKKYPILRFVPDCIVDFVLTYVWKPVIISYVSGAKKRSSGEAISGIIISIPLIASRIMKDRERAKKCVVEAVKIAEQKGVNIMGLGALTASITLRGLHLIPHARSLITTGRLFTAKTVTDTVSDIADELELVKEIVSVAIVGAGGSIGSASVQLLLRRGFKKFVLIDRSHQRERMTKIKDLLLKQRADAMVELHDSLNMLVSADIIVAATNRPDALIKSEHLKPGAVVVDDAQPSDVDPSVVFTRNDVLVLEGGVIHAPGINTHFDLGLKHAEDIYSCLAEVIILSYIEYETHMSVGGAIEVDFEALAKLSEAADTLGFKRGEYQNFQKVYTREDIQFVKQVIHNKW